MTGKMREERWIMFSISMVLMNMTIVVGSTDCCFLNVSVPSQVLINKWENCNMATVMAFLIYNINLLLYWFANTKIKSIQTQIQ